MWNSIMQRQQQCIHSYEYLASCMLIIQYLIGGKR